MMILPNLKPCTLEQLPQVVNEEARVLALEREVEAKSIALRTWQQDAPILGKVTAETEEIAEDALSVSETDNDTEPMGADYPDSPTNRVPA